MLNAILHSKDRYIGNSQENFRSMYNDIEDFFTAAIFSRFTYLPVSEQSRILTLLTGDKKFLMITELKNREFWPSWYLDIENRRVEPDLFLEYDIINVIVEAKRNDVTLHSAEQLQREIDAYLSEYPSNKKFILLAIGGGCSFQHENIVYIGWKNLFQILYEYGDNNTKWIFKDMIDAFYLHGFYPTKWLESLPYENINLKDSLKTYEGWIR